MKLIIKNYLHLSAEVAICTRPDWMERRDISRLLCQSIWEPVYLRDTEGLVRNCHLYLLEHQPGFWLLKITQKERYLPLETFVPCFFKQKGYPVHRDSWKELGLALEPMIAIALIPFSNALWEHMETLYPGMKDLRAFKGLPMRPWLNIWTG